MTALVAAYALIAAGSTAALARPASSATVLSGADRGSTVALDGADVGSAEINQSLDALAKLFATAIADEDLREQIHGEVSKRFDGDTNALYETLVGTSDVRQVLASAYTSSLSNQLSNSVALTAIDDMASTIPRFQVAVPVKFDDWDPANFTPLVGFMPEGVDDTTLQSITAYDAKGTAHTLDAQVDPTEPVIILGLNERTDDSGELLQPAPLPEPEPSEPPLSTQATYEVRMIAVYLRNDLEPWPKGDAEIKLRAKGGGVNFAEPNWVDLDVSGDIWGGAPIVPGVRWHDPRILGYVSSDGVRFYWWEDDGDQIDFSVTFASVGLTINMCDCDDEIGTIKLPMSSFSTGTDRTDNWTALQMVTD